MRVLVLSFLFLAGSAAVQAEEFDLYRPFREALPTIEIAGSCTLDREATSGSKKFCYYNCIGGEKTVTIKANEYCPLDMD